MPSLGREPVEWQQWLQALDRAGLACRVPDATAAADRRLLTEFIRHWAAPQTAWLIRVHGDRDAVRYLADVADAEEGAHLEVRPLPQSRLWEPARHAALACCAGPRPALDLLDAAAAAGLPALALQVDKAELGRAGPRLLRGPIEPIPAAARCAVITCGTRMAAAWTREAIPPAGEWTHWAAVGSDGAAIASSPPSEHADERSPRRLARWLAAAGVGAAFAVGVAVAAWGHHGGGPAGSSSSTVTARPSPLSGQLFAPSAPLLLDSAAFAADQRNGNVVVFGGAGTDTWIWDGQFMQRVQPVASPRASTDAAIAFDPDSRRILLFGGIVGAQTPDAGTWTWDGRNWTQLAVTQGPTEGGAALLAYDHTRRQLVLVACCSPTGRTATWTWDGAGWGLLADTAPPTKAGSRLADDPVHGRLILVASFTGATGVAATWTWDGTGWAEVASGTGPPSSRALQLLEDPLEGGLLGVVPSASGSGVQTWRWDGRQWTPLGRAGGPSVLRLGLTPPATRVPVLLGRGSAEDAPMFPWVWSGAQWVEQDAVHLLPDPASAIASDPATGGAVAFGGQPPDAETWTWDGHLWTLRRPPASPPARTEAAMADDPLTHTAVLFGGKLATGEAAGDTWTWDGNTWTQAHPASSPPPDLLQPMAYDPVHHDVVLVVTCCRAAGSITAEQTWTWDGATWTRHETVESPPPLLTATMTFDPVSQRVLLYGGDDLRAARVSTDTWSWDGLTWTRLHPGTSPSQGGVMVGDPVTSQVVLVSGSGGGPASPPDTWVWDGQTWTARPSPHGTAPAGGIPIYAAASAGVVVFLSSDPIIESWDGRRWSTPAR